jgi:hypothetical protein
MSKKEPNILMDMLCDPCCYKVETNPSIPIADLCDRCKKKLLDALFGAAEEHERLLDTYEP